VRSRLWWRGQAPNIEEGAGGNIGRHWAGRSGTDKGRAWEVKLESPDDAGDVLPFDDEDPADPSQRTAIKISAAPAAKLQGADRIADTISTQRISKMRSILYGIVSHPHADGHGVEPGAPCDMDRHAAPPCDMASRCAR
jgi:hypothetical protein